MLEDDLAEGAGLSAGEVLVDVQSRPSFEEAGIKVLSGDRVEPLEERSALVRSLGEAQWNYWRFGVYCPRNKLESVRRVCSERGWMAE
jgi:HD superfamily phosphohydrolase